MRIRADTRRAPARIGRRAQGAPLGVLGISWYIPSTSLRGHGSWGMLAGGNMFTSCWFSWEEGTQKVLVRYWSTHACIPTMYRYNP